MKAVVQRVSQASVRVEGRTVGEIGWGFLVLAAAHKNDTEQNATKIADRIAGLRIFNDGEGMMNLALSDLPAELNVGVLAISNFTVYGETAKNRRPSFTEAAPYARGEELFNQFISALKEKGMRVEQGIFGADMKVSLVNEGPVTVILEV